MLRFSHFISGAVGPRKHQFLVIYFFSHKICIAYIPLYAEVEWMKDIQVIHEDFHKAKEAPYLKVINKSP